jgi:hypothetical protein
MNGYILNFLCIIPQLPVARLLGVEYWDGSRMMNKKCFGRKQPTFERQPHEYKFKALSVEQIARYIPPVSNKLYQAF